MGEHSRVREAVAKYRQTFLVQLNVIKTSLISPKFRSKSGQRGEITTIGATTEPNDNLTRRKQRMSDIYASTDYPNVLNEACWSTFHCIVSGCTACLRVTCLTDNREYRVRGWISTVAHFSVRLLAVATCLVSLSLVATSSNVLPSCSITHRQDERHRWYRRV